jgi:RHS repeat-associated protein
MGTRSCGEVGSLKNVRHGKNLPPCTTGVYAMCAQVLDTPQENPCSYAQSASGHTKMGIIHMNGRVYDPLIGRMMSADPIVPNPYDLLSFNRYSYTRNNPLNRTDPSGFDDGSDSDSDSDPRDGIDSDGNFHIYISGVPLSPTTSPGPDPFEPNPNSPSRPTVPIAGPASLPIPIPLPTPLGPIPGFSLPPLPPSASIPPLNIPALNKYGTWYQILFVVSPPLAMGLDVMLSNNPAEANGDRDNTPAPALPGDPYSPDEVDRRRSQTRDQLGAPSRDPDSPIPDQGPGKDMGGHDARGRTPHETGERNVNSNEEHSRRPKNNPSGRPRR